MNLGWISLHRKFKTWEWYTDNNVKSLFIHCLLTANIRNKKWRGIQIKRGQFFTSIQHLGFELNMTNKQIRIAIDKLKRTGELTTEGASKGTMITIYNYDTYQKQDATGGRAKGQTKGKRRASKGQTKGNNIIIKDKEYNEKNDNKKNPFHSEMKTVFMDFYKFKSGTEYYWTGKDANQLNLLTNKLKKKIEESEQDITCENITHIFGILLKKLPKWYIENGLTPAIINSKFNEIIIQIKTAKNEQISDQDIDKYFQNKESA